MLVARRPWIALCLAFSAPVMAQLGDLDERLRTTPITTQQLAENFHVLFGVGGNIIVSIGANGVLVVDDQFPQMVPKYKAKIAELGGGSINFAINTHWHFDHADGNQVLGPEGTWLVAHESSRQMMTKNNVGLRQPLLNVTDGCPFLGRRHDGVSAAGHDVRRCDHDVG